LLKIALFEQILAKTDEFSRELGEITGFHGVMEQVF
jgi:hypothetical protein